MEVDSYLDTDWTVIYMSLSRFVLRFTKSPRTPRYRWTLSPTERIINRKCNIYVKLGI